jgi:hypothetical protein
VGDIQGTHVDGAQDESGEGESAQAQRSGIAELATLDGLVQTGLELTTEGGEGCFGSVDVGERSVAEARGGASYMVLFGGHLGLHGSAIATVLGRGSGTHVLLHLGVVGVVDCFSRRHDGI